MICDLKACLMSVNLHNHKDLADPSIKQIGKLNQVEIDSVFHCDGLLLLLLCNPKDNSIEAHGLEPLLGSNQVDPT